MLRYVKVEGFTGTFASLSETSFVASLKEA